MRKVIEIYTDGACSGNPGPGGYGVVLLEGDRRKEFSKGFRKTTNNRMELMGVIAGLEKADPKADITVYTDSKYISDAVNKGWAARWKNNQWKRNKREYAENADLWKRLLDLTGSANISFKWIKGHNRNPNNERADRIAVKAASGKNLTRDQAYERGETMITPPKLF